MPGTADYTTSAGLVSDSTEAIRDYGRLASALDEGQTLRVALSP